MLTVSDKTTWLGKMFQKLSALLVKPVVCYSCLVFRSMLYVSGERTNERSLFANEQSAQ